MKGPHELQASRRAAANDGANGNRAKRADRGSADATARTSAQVDERGKRSVVSPSPDPSADPSAPVEPSSDLLAMTVAIGILRNGRTGGVATRLLRQRRRWGSRHRRLHRRLRRPPACREHQGPGLHCPKGPAADRRRRIDQRDLVLRRRQGRPGAQHLRGVQGRRPQPRPLLDSGTQGPQYPRQRRQTRTPSRHTAWPAWPQTRT
jgi:hypothetical protein